MPLDPNIYSRMDTQAPERLAELFNPIRRDEQRNSLADLAVQREMRKMQLTEAQQAQRDQAELKMALEHSGGDYEKMYQFAVQANTPESMAFAQKIKPEVERMRGGSIADKLEREKFEYLKSKPQNVNYNQPFLPTGEPNIPYQEYQRGLKPAGGGGSGQPYFTPVQTAQGVMAFNARTGRMEPINIGGSAVVGAGADPALQGKIAGAKAFGKTTEEDRGKAIADAPRVVDNANEAIRLADELIKHPGMKQAVGASSMLGIQKIPGTQARDFMNRLDQIKGGAFLEAFNTLRGGGQITEIEGKKATDAIARMDNATSEEAFAQAVMDYKNVIQDGVERAKRKTQQPTAVPTSTFDADKEARYQAWKAQQGR